MSINKGSVGVVPILLGNYIKWQKRNAEDDIDIKRCSHFLLMGEPDGQIEIIHGPDA